MTDEQLLSIAQEQGFNPAIIGTQDVVVDYSFRKFCEDNLCGKYGANYSCPPDCGTPEQVYKKLLSKDSALVLQMIYDIESYEDKAKVQQARAALNKAVLAVMDKMNGKGYSTIPLGYNGCPHCNPCKRTLNRPCILPERQISCVSAYCINVTELAKTCGLDFTWSDKKLYLFGMILFDKQ